MSSDDIVCLTKTSNPQEAYLLCEMLKEHNIHGRVVGDMLDAGLGDVPGFQPEVWVLRDDLPLAAKLLEEHRHLVDVSAKSEQEDDADEVEV